MILRLRHVTGAAMALVVLVVLAALVSACQPDSQPKLDDSANTAAATQEGAADLEDCDEPALNASVRGATGTFATAEGAARSVKDLPDDGSMALMEAREASAVFGWVRAGRVLYIIDTHRGDEGWTVGSYVKCAAGS